MKSDIGIIGLAVMGENLAVNLESKGYGVSVFNIETEWVSSFVNGRGKGKNFYGANSFCDFVSSLKTPRIIWMMIKSGEPVDMTIEALLPYIDNGDIIIDGGNSHFKDTERRCEYLKEKGVFFIGTGVSGGEEGALKGPSLMPGGNYDGWKAVKPVFDDVSAKTEEGEPCCSWMGNGGAGHFVKTVHNGIEYGDMQIICEVYWLMKNHLGMTNGEMRSVFKKWNEEELNSFLIKITEDILGYKENGEEVVDMILDVAGQKGTGKWASIAALDEGVALTLINEAVYARCLSSLKEERIAASKILRKTFKKFNGNREDFLNDLKNAMYVSKIISYAQGFALMRTASDTYGWNLDLSKVASAWRGGCIIRSAFLNDIKRAYEKNPGLKNLMLDDYFIEVFKKNINSLRKVVSESVLNGFPVPAISSALSYFDGYSSENLPVNLLQAQRDYFGAHTYERKDCERGKFFHTDWTGNGGKTKSSVYNL